MLPVTVFQIALVPVGGPCWSKGACTQSTRYQSAVSQLLGSAACGSLAGRAHHFTCGVLQLLCAPPQLLVQRRGSAFATALSAELLCCASCDSKVGVNYRSKRALAAVRARLCAHHTVKCAPDIIRVCARRQGWRGRAGDEHVQREAGRDEAATDAANFWRDHWRLVWRVLAHRQRPLGYALPGRLSASSFRPARGVRCNVLCY